MTLTWQNLLSAEKQKPYYLNIENTLQQQRKNEIIFPTDADIFNALTYTPFKNVKVVIIGQDPYHGEKQAHGLCFSVQPGIKPPPSLVNIFKEIKQDVGISPPTHGCLVAWAQQGVLLLNTVLTVVAKQPHSHAQLGWQNLTDTIIKSLNQHAEAIVFMLWGAHAQKKSALIENPKHLILTAPHPSPLSAYRGFLGCKHFSKCNTWLIQNKRKPINWDLA